jgi:hypothetical protein
MVALILSFAKHLPEPPNIQIISCDPEVKTPLTDKERLIVECHDIVDGLSCHDIVDKKMCHHIVEKVL